MPLGRQHGGGVQHGDVLHVAPRRHCQRPLAPHVVGEVTLPGEGPGAAADAPGPVRLQRRRRGEEPLAGRQDGQVTARLLAVGLGGGEQGLPALLVVVGDVDVRGLRDGGHGGERRERWLNAAFC